MMTSLRNSPSLRQYRSSLVTVIPPSAGGGGYVNNLQAHTHTHTHARAHSAMNGSLRWLSFQLHYYAESSAVAYHNNKYSCHLLVSMISVPAYTVALL